MSPILHTAGRTNYTQRGVRLVSPSLPAADMIASDSGVRMHRSYKKEEWEEEGKSTLNEIQECVSSVCMSRMCELFFSSVARICLMNGAQGRRVALGFFFFIS